MCSGYENAKKDVWSDYIEDKIPMKLIYRENKF